MAEKRQSVAGKVATPKVAPQSQELSASIGARVRITTSLANHTLEGTLFTACPVTNVVAINTTPPPPNPSSTLANQPGDYHIIPIAHIAKFTILSRPAEADRVEGAGPGFDGALPSIAKLDLDALRAREETAVRKLKEKEATRNRSATKEGQELFDHLSRTLPTRWHENSIIVNELVIVGPPYGVADCKANKDGQNSLQQVKKVMEGYYNKRRVAQNTTARPGVATPVPPRKGG